MVLSHGAMIVLTAPSSWKSGEKSMKSHSYIRSARKEISAENKTGLAESMRAVHVQERISTLVSNKYMSNNKPVTPSYFHEREESAELDPSAPTLI